MKRLEKLFLPFTPNGKLTEKKAIKVKERLSIGAYSSVDPYQVLEKIDARVVELKRGNAPTTVIKIMTEGIGKEWSAIGIGESPVDGKEVIFVNPNHPATRQKVSLMEEVIHIVLNHPKVKLQEINGRWKRSYEKQVEDEAFNVGAACIIPYRPLFNMLRYQNRSAKYISNKFDVSTEYVEYRIKRAGLYKIYTKVYN